ncbi:MAG: diacylglycerol/lipid kinase family protein [bacterium]
MRTRLIINPAAGNNGAIKYLPEIERALNERGVDYSKATTEKPGDAQRLARIAAEEGVDIAVSVGGDGTIHEIANGIANTDTALGMIPLGTGNDFPSYFGLRPRDIEGACDVIARGKKKRIDAAKVGDVLYVGIGGTGIDSEVNRMANSLPKFPGIYTLGVLATLIRFRPKRVVVKYDGGEFRGEVTLVVVGNSKAYGHGMIITPQASVEDGWLDLCIGERANKFVILYLFTKIFKGQHTSHPKVKMMRAKKVSISSPDYMEFFADGDFIKTLPVEIEVAPRALWVVVP